MSQAALANLAKLAHGVLLADLAVLLPLCLTLFSRFLCGNVKAKINVRTMWAIRRTFGVFISHFGIFAGGLSHIQASSSGVVHLPWSCTLMMQDYKTFSINAGMP